MMALTGKNGSAMGTGNMAQGGDDGGVSVNVVGSGFVSHSTVTEEAVTTRYFYSGGTLTDIRHPDYTMHFTYDAVGPATVTYNGTVYYYLRNAQGDVTGLVNAAGQTVVKYAYDAWGNPLAATGSMAATLGRDNPLRYRGYVYDTETGLYYLKSRYYNPERGRFINADGYVSTGQGVLGSNMFAYCNSNPSNMADENGKIPYRTANVRMTDGGNTHFIPINGQERDKYKDIPYGKSNIGRAGCEAIATYNAMGLLGKAESFESVVSYFTNRFESVPFSGFGMKGHFGATPKDIQSYLDLKDISYVGSRSLSTIIESVQEQGRGVLIISFWNRPMTDGYHTIAINYDGHNYSGYNYYSKESTPQPYATINDFLANDWRFIYGFYIPYS